MKQDKGVKSDIDNTNSTEMGYGRNSKMNPSALPMHLLSPD